MGTTLHLSKYTLPNLPHSLRLFLIISVTTHECSSPQTTVQTAASGEKTNLLHEKMAAKEKGHHDSNIQTGGLTHRMRHVSTVCTIRKTFCATFGNYLLHNVHSDEVSFRCSSTASSCKLEQNNIV